MNQHHKILKQKEAQHAPSLLKKHGLICKQLPWDGGLNPLYLAKPHWTNRFDKKRESTIGIFCSIWVTVELLEENQFAYNIHAKQLRKLPGYKLGAREFASEFRKLVKAQVASWPNIRLDFGPLTLLEGRDSCELDAFADNVDERISAFVEIHQHIDDLLEATAL